MSINQPSRSWENSAGRRVFSTKRASPPAHQIPNHQLYVRSHWHNESFLRRFGDLFFGWKKLFWRFVGEMSLFLVDMFQKKHFNFVESRLKMEKYWIIATFLCASRTFRNSRTQLLPSPTDWTMKISFWEAGRYMLQLTGRSRKLPENSWSLVKLFWGKRLAVPNLVFFGIFVGIWFFVFFHGTWNQGPVWSNKIWTSTDC